MSFFPSLLFWNGNEKSFKTNTTKLQSVLPRCQTYNIQALSEIRRQNRCLKTRYLETNFNVKNGILKHFRLKVKKKVILVGMFLFLLMKSLKLFYIIQNAIIFLMVGLKSNYQ